MAEELTHTIHLATHFEPKTIQELGIGGSQLIATTSHQPTYIAKTGIALLLSKTPWISDAPVAMDIDIACGLYDRAGVLLQTVWYGLLRSQDDMVRHHGDTFIGMNKAYRPNSVEESVSIRHMYLDERIQTIAIFVHSATQAPLKSAIFGKVTLHDNEHHHIHTIDFASLDDKDTGICAWQLSRSVDNTFKIAAPIYPITAKTIEELAKKYTPIP